MEASLKLAAERLQALGISEEATQDMLSDARGGDDALVRAALGVMPQVQQPGDGAATSDKTSDKDGAPETGTGIGNAAGSGGCQKRTSKVAPAKGASSTSVRSRRSPWLSSRRSEPFSSTPSTPRSRPTLPSLRVTAM